MKKFMSDSSNKNVPADASLVSDYPAWDLQKLIDPISSEYIIRQLSYRRHILSDCKCLREYARVTNLLSLKLYR